MLTRLFGPRRERARIATAIYGAIVAHARAPALYRDLRVPDTVSGRFEMVVVHAALVLGRLQAGSAAEAAAGQAAFDLFCIDMDRSLRELGIGDVGVPKKMRQMGQAFYGRARAYDECLQKGDLEALAAALRRNVFKNSAEGDRATGLARYVMTAAAAVADQSPAALMNDGPRFPDPAAFAPTTVTAAGAPA